MPLTLVFISIFRTCSGGDERGACSADEVLDIDASPNESTDRLRRMRSA